MELSESSEAREREFVNLLVSHQTVIRAYVISMLPGLAEAEDVIQNTCQVLWTKREQFVLGTNFKAWALTTARFQVMSMQQKLRNERRQPLDEDVLALVADRAMETDVAELNRKLNDLNECISQLQVRDQELVLHRYWNKAGLLEYARATGRSVGALKVSLYRIRESLRDCLERKSRMREETA
jgi:RNA polymerase sigma-70 factor (ECF subfamily)